MGGFPVTWEQFSVGQKREKTSIFQQLQIHNASSVNANYFKETNPSAKNIELYLINKHN